MLQEWIDASGDNLRMKTYKVAFFTQRFNGLFLIGADIILHGNRILFTVDLGYRSFSLIIERIT